jgi:phage tail sheath protein FI
MTIYQNGQINAAALYAPGLYTQVVPPTTLYIQGVDTNLLGFVGIASWGPVNSPQLVGSPSDALQFLGTQAVRKRDLATAVAIALSIGANQIKTVRVTDGTDAAATIAVQDSAGTPATGATLTAFYTGTEGNKITAAITAGTKASTFKLTLNRPGFSGESFDNIGGTGLAFWTNLVSAVNNGISDQRGPSQLVIATVGTSTATPNVTSTFTLTGGADGAASITDTMMIGIDGANSTRSGMYSLRGSGVMTAALVDHTDSTAWSTILLFGLQEGIFFGQASAVGISTDTTITNLNTAGADGYGLKVLSGDWVYWQDQVNNQQRLLSPATFWAALRATLNPNESTLNKPVLGLIGTQRSAQSLPYSNAELGNAAKGRIDYIANPSAGGNYFGFQTDRNAASSTSTNSEAYTMMTNFLALSFQSAFGYAIGKDQTPELRKEIKDSIQAFLSNLWLNLKFIGDVNHPSVAPYSVTIDITNNPDSQVALGVMAAYIKVKYFSIVREFVVSLEGGQSVSVVVQ